MNSTNSRFNWSRWDLLRVGVAVVITAYAFWGTDQPSPSLYGLMIFLILASRFIQDWFKKRHKTKEQ